MALERDTGALEHEVRLQSFVVPMHEALGCRCLGGQGGWRLVAWQLKEALGVFKALVSVHKVGLKLLCHFDKPCNIKE